MQLVYNNSMSAESAASARPETRAASCGRSLHSFTLSRVSTADGRDLSRGAGNLCRGPYSNQLTGLVSGLEQNPGCDEACVCALCVVLWARV